MRIQGSNIAVEGGEYVVNRQSTDKNLGLLGYINSQRRELDSNDLHTFFSTPFPRYQRPEFTSMFEEGGQVPISPMSDNSDVERLLAGMQNLKIDSHVSVTDINTVQQNMVRVDEWTGI